MQPEPLRLPSIDGLRAFDAAARLGTFERAADELAITASAVAKRVATVEDLLGTTLLQRTGKALVLTAAGKEYLEQVRAALQLLAAMPLHRRTVQRRERLKVVAPPTFARQILVPRLEAFTAAHPDIELEIGLSMPYLDEGPHDADVVVRHGDPGLLGGEVLMHDVVLPLVAPALLAAKGPVNAATDLSRFTLLRTPLEPWCPWFRAAGLAWPEPDQGPSLIDLGLALEAAVSSQGVALARPALARQWIQSGSLVPAWPLTVVPAHQYVVLAASSAVAAEFAAWLRARCTDEARLAQQLLER